MIYPKLNINADQRHSETGWKVKRVAWSVLLLFLIFVAAGGTGNGLLSSRKVADGDLYAEYEKIQRYQKRMELVITLKGGQDRFYISNDFLEKCRINSIQPEPLQINKSLDHTGFVFGNSNKELRVIIEYEPAERWVAHFEVSDGKGNSITDDILIYP